MLNSTLSAAILQVYSQEEHLQINDRNHSDTERIVKNVWELTEIQTRMLVCLQSTVWNQSDIKKMVKYIREFIPIQRRHLHTCKWQQQWCTGCMLANSLEGIFKYVREFHTNIHKTHPYLQLTAAITFFINRKFICQSIITIFKCRENSQVMFDNSYKYRRDTSTQ